MTMAFIFHLDRSSTKGNYGDRTRHSLLIHVRLVSDGGVVFVNKQTDSTVVAMTSLRRCEENSGPRRRRNTRDNASGQPFHVERRPRMRTALRRELHPRPQRDCPSLQLRFSVTATGDAVLASFARRKNVLKNPCRAKEIAWPIDRSCPARDSDWSHDPHGSTETPRRGEFFARAMARRPPHFFSLLVGFKVSLPFLAGDSTLAGWQCHPKNQ